MPSVAVIQFAAVPGSADANREKIARRISEAAERGAELIVVPELAISGYTTKRDLLERASEPAAGATLASWQSIAASRNVMIAGGFCERDGERLYNSAILVSPEGVLLHYRKLHLFDQEKNVFSPGDLGLTVVPTRLGRIGLCVCYDLRFVEVARALALQGADLIAVPTAWVRGFDPNPRDAMGYIGQLRGAAVQSNLNQVYMACASHCAEADGISFLGSSAVIDPYGALLAGPLGDAEEKIELASYDPEIARAAQNRSALVRPREDRRTDIYRLHVSGKDL